MSRVPEPTQTPEGPAYEGRLLDRPEDEVVDQGAPFDLRTLVSRRSIIAMAGVGVGTMALAACSSAAGGSTTSTGAASSGAVPSGEIPDETAGPYPGDGSNGPDVLEQSGIVRSDIRTSIGGGATAEGVPLTFSLTILDMANDDAPFEGAAVYAWHCDAEGQYSMYADAIANETYLRGVQVADAEGTVTFTSIFPACYDGRWPHIHFEVYPDVDSITDVANVIATSQIALPEEACAAVYAQSGYEGSSENFAGVSLESDGVFGDDGGELELATVTGDVESGYLASLTARVDTTTELSGGGMGGAPSGGGPGGGTPPEGAPGSN